MVTIWLLRRPGVALAVSLAAVAAVPVSAGAVTAPRSASIVRAQKGSDNYVDVRAGARASVARNGAATAAGVSSATRTARAGLARSLGRQAVVQVDRLTGTPRVLARLDGTLTGPASGDAADVAMSYVRRHLAALGLSSGDLTSLHLASRVTSPGGLTVLRWSQTYRGIPAVDNDLRVAVAGDGRIVSVWGSPIHGLSVSSITPTVAAVRAARKVQANVLGKRAPAVRRATSGVRRQTRFRGGDFARLVLFGEGTSARLAWHLTYKRDANAWFDAVVDARTGAILRRFNMTKGAQDASVWDNYPGAPAGGTAQTRDLSPWLTSTTRLIGPNAHEWADTNDNSGDFPTVSDEVPDPATEEIPSSGGGNFTYAFTPFARAAGGCTPTALCSWTPDTPTSWQTNRNQDGVQAFYFVNKYHDHLLAPPIGFTPASGNFQVAGPGGDDPVLVESDDGAGTAADGGPDPDHVNNANFSTPPEGNSPRMQMYLFFNDPDIAPFRDVNGGDDASVVYHEYTHGLSNRLITDADGAGAVNTPQAGAMGEAWSDWYAKDFLNDEGLQPDTAAPGDVDMGGYTDAVPHTIRSQGLDCPVGAPVAQCPGSPQAGSGGYTYGDFTKVAGRPEVHRDGEIWSETLWDLRGAVSSEVAEGLVTTAMRLSPPEPSYLDERNAVLLADQALYDGAHTDTIWTTFAQRGMGFFAGAADGSDIAPAEDFHAPPAASTPTGSIAGRVTGATSGLPVAGVRVAIGGLNSGQFGFEDTTDANGNYRIDGVPAGSYTKLVFLPSAGFDQVANPVTVPANGTVTVDAAMRRDWSSLSGGANVVDTNDDTSAPFGCGADAAIDQSRGVGWSAFNPHSPDYPSPPLTGDPPTMTVELPAAIGIQQFGIDPSNTCGDGPSASVQHILVETAPAVSGPFTVALDHTFAAGDISKLNVLPAAGGGATVKFVRITLLSPFNEGPGFSGRDFIDLTEFEVFGDQPNILPAGPLAASPQVAAVGQSVQFDASRVTDPDSAITQYRWDFDGNGTIDQVTQAPITGHAYAAARTYNATVFVDDFRGGSGEAQTPIRATGGPAPPPLAAPRFSGFRTSRHAVAFSVRCDSRCTVRGKLVVSKKPAKKLRLQNRTVGTLKRTVAANRTTRLSLKLTNKVLRAMKRHHVKSLKATMTLSARDAEHQVANAKTRHPKLRR